MYVCYPTTKCLFIRTESFDLVDITAIVPKCDHLIVCILVVRFRIFFGKDDDLMKFEGKKQNTQKISEKRFLLAQFHNSMQHRTRHKPLTSLFRIVFGDVGTPITSIHPLTGAFSGSAKLIVTSMSSVVFPLIVVAWRSTSVGTFTWMLTCWPEKLRNVDPFTSVRGWNEIILTVFSGFCSIKINQKTILKQKNWS